MSACLEIHMPQLFFISSHRRNGDYILICEILCFFFFSEGYMLEICNYFPSEDHAFASHVTLQKV